jgi:hypothetical protein
VKDYEYRKLALNDTAYAVVLRLKLAASCAESILFPNSEGKPIDITTSRPSTGGRQSAGMHPECSPSRSQTRK